MFNLEQSILKWRQGMLAAGIQTPVPLEELESHLREEIEEQVKLGSKEAEAFQAAVQYIGQERALQSEFRRAGGFSAWLGHDRFTRISRALGILWMAKGLLNIYMFYGDLGILGYYALFTKSAVHWQTPHLFAITTDLLLELAGITGGIWLFRGAKSGRITIKILAVIGVTQFVLELLDSDLRIGFGPIYLHLAGFGLVHFYPYVWMSGQMALYLCSIRLLRAPQTKKARQV